MEWKEVVVSDPEIEAGKPIIKGSHLTVEFILSLYAGGWSQKEVIENYPILTKDILRLMFEFVAESVAGSDASLF